MSLPVVDIRPALPPGAMYGDYEESVTPTQVTRTWKVLLGEIISDRQFFQQLAVMGQITQSEALAAVSTGAIPAVMESSIVQLPEENQFEARMLLSGAKEFYRHHQMTEVIRQLMGWTSEETDALWAAAFQL